MKWASKNLTLKEVTHPENIRFMNPFTQTGVVSPAATDTELSSTNATKKKLQLPRGFSLQSRMNNNNNDIKRRMFAQHIVSAAKNASSQQQQQLTQQNPQVTFEDDNEQNIPIEGGYYEASLNTKRAIYQQLSTKGQNIENEQDEIFARRVHYNGLIVMDPIPLINPSTEKAVIDEKKRMYHNQINDVSLLLFSKYVTKSSKMKDTLARSLERQTAHEEKAKNHINKITKTSIFTKNLKRKLVRNIKQQFAHYIIDPSLSSSLEQLHKDLYNPSPPRAMRHDAMPKRNLPRTFSGKYVSYKTESPRTSISSKPINFMDSISSTEDLPTSTARFSKSVAEDRQQQQQHHTRSSFDRNSVTFQIDQLTVSKQRVHPSPQHTRRVLSAKDDSSQQRESGLYDPEILSKKNSSPSVSMSSQSIAPSSQTQSPLGYYPLQPRVFSANSGLKRSTMENIYSARVPNKGISRTSSQEGLFKSNSLSTTSLQSFLRSMNNNNNPSTASGNSTSRN